MRRREMVCLAIGLAALTGVRLISRLGGDGPGWRVLTVLVVGVGVVALVIAFVDRSRATFRTRHRR